METISPLSTNQPEINELVRIYAKEKGISESAAWVTLNKVWIPKAQIYDVYGLPSQPQPQQQSIVTAELLAGKQNISIQKLELDYKIRQLEYQEKTEARIREVQERLEAREAQKLELEKEKIKNDKELALAKLDLEKTIADRKAEQESRRIDSKEDFDAKLLLIQAGKKPEDAVEKFYERLFEEKKENDQSLEKLRKEHSDQLQKLENSIKNKSSPEDVFDQLEKLKKVEKGMMETTLTSLEAYGVDTKALRKVAKMEEKAPDGGIYEVGKKIWTDFLKPNIDKAQRELTPPSQLSSQQQGPTPEQIEQQRYEADRLRREMDAKQKEKDVLEAQIKQEREIYEQRHQLEMRAAELGIPVNVGMTNREISDAIVRQEFALNQVREERLKLEAEAIVFGIPFNDLLTNDQLFDMIEHRESEIGRERAQRERVATQHLTKVEEKTKPLPTVEAEPVEPVITTQAGQVQTPVQAEPEQTETEVTDIKEELTKPPEVSKETEEFLSGRGGQVAEHRDTVVQMAETIKEAVQETSEVLVESQEKDIPKKKGGKKKDKQERQDRKEKQSKTYQVVREDGEQIGDVEAKNPHGAAMKAARIIGAAEDAPVIINISGGGLDKEQIYEVAMTSTEGRGGKTIQVAKAKRVQE